MASKTPDSGRETTAAIQTLLHAAALDGRDAKTLYQWALNPTLAADAVRILSSHPNAAEGWADSLDAMVQADPRTRDSIWQGVSLAFSALADPRVLEAVSPRPGEEFDPKPSSETTEPCTSSPPELEPVRPQRGRGVHRRSR